MIFRKQRKFFEERSSAPDASLTDPSVLSTNSTRFHLRHQINSAREPDNGSKRQELAEGITGTSGFDQETIESIICDKKSGGDIERAVNIYFDGSWKTDKTELSPANKRPNKPLRGNIPDYRYVGAFGVEGWATRSGVNLLKYGEVIRIERQKIQPPKLASSRGRPAVSQAPKPNSAAAKRIDVIVRFTNSSGAEVGRLSRECANWVSTLMDQKVCKFEGTCVYAPERVRTNDTILLQLRCSLLKSAFDSRRFNPQENRKTGMFEEKETSEEKELRLRQVALVKLFEEVNLLPTTSSTTNVQHKQNGISSPPSEEEEGKELEQDQLDTLYKKHSPLTLMRQQPNLLKHSAMNLRQYQKQALLYWNREASMHPLWEEYSWPIKDSFYVNPYSGELSLEFPIQEQHCLGGILADEMGLGKTIEMMSLIHTHRSRIAMEAQGAINTKPTSVNGLPRLPARLAPVENAPCTTLVVAPMSLLAQWQSEAENARKKEPDLQALCCEANAASAPNVIITSYGVVLSEYNQVAARNGDKGGGLFSLKYFRVILDEAHHIKNRQAKSSKACYEINAEHRWVLTGTPIVNRLEDLFSLVRFLRVEPWNNFSFWKTFITVPFESKDFMQALDVVQTVLEPLVLRRTKDMKTPTGEALVPLPPKTIDIVEIELSKPEREVYDHIFTRAKPYTSIFAQILRLRQSCCHPILTRNQDMVAEEEEAGEKMDAASGLADDMDLQSLIERFTAATDDTADSNAFGAHVLEQIRDEAENECPICSEEPMIEQTVTGCWHSACKKCLSDYITHQTGKGEIPRCPSCREVINLRDIFEVVKDDRHPDSLDDKPKITLQRLGSNSSAKIGALLSHLKALRISLPGTKSVVFSQFTSFLSLIEPALTRASIPFLRLDGSMTQQARATVLKDYAASKKGIVLLLSLRAGGVGLNLTMAKRVYMMDPWWSFAVEAQAIDRVHRMGQTDEVKVCRFIVSESIEQKMLKIQERKKFIATSLGMMSDAEKKLQRIEDIKELLS
ncbi:SNF2 family N-terminal domain-containing protein [Bisporella sp. PMI_857]|nr:SNF2 family N-terminal domain-containing protein [Bisporella sp. PMI_857]